VERIDQIMARLLVGGRRIAPDKPIGNCALCGTEATHGNSLVADKDCEHFSCREKLRAGAITLLVLEQDYLRVAEALSKEGVLYTRLEQRLLPYVTRPSSVMLCRMITFCLAEIAHDPSIRGVRKTYLSNWLADIRGTYLPTSN